ncbi:MAG: PorT family protein, partial [Prevotellaceae bacterium]|nr:PorT family protein [Prevotellaceae bacterium]
MKKFILLMAAAVLLSMPAQAKLFGFGIKAGLEIPDISTEDVVGSVKGYTGFHAGFLAQVNVPIIGLGIQPEVLYVNRGLKYANDEQRINNIDVPVNITWGIDLKVVRPFIAVTPFVSYRFD